MDRELERRIIDCVAAHARRVAAVYLFGSTARGTATVRSDIDLGILFSENPPSTLDAQPYALEAAVEREAGRPVEIVVLNHAPADLRIRILRDGHLIVENDRPARIAFEVRTRNDAFDLAPILHRYRTARGTGR